MTMRLQFPHIPRIFSAIILWTLLAGAVSFNVYSLLHRPLAYTNELAAVFSRPFSGPAHQELAQALWNSGRREAAKREFAVAAEFNSVLGVDTTAQAERETAKVNYWQEIAATHPDYRDAYIQLAHISYAQGNLTQTKAYLSQAAAIDPNGKAVGDLLKFISPLGL